MNPERYVQIDYTNWRGERITRIIEPIPGGLHFNLNRYHPEPQWLITALDISGDGTLKTFSATRIHSWTSVPIPQIKPVARQLTPSR